MLSEAPLPTEPKKGMYAPEIARTVSTPALIIGRNSHPELLALPIPQCPGAVLRIGGWGTFASDALDYQTAQPERPMLVGFSISEPPDVAQFTH